MAPKRKNSGAAQFVAFLITALLGVIIFMWLRNTLATATTEHPSGSGITAMYDTCRTYHGGILDVKAEAGYAVIVCTDGTVLRG